MPQRRSRRPEVEALSGQRRVPVLILEGDVICDSRRIVEHLELRRGEQPGDRRPVDGTAGDALGHQSGDESRRREVESGLRTGSNT